MSNPMTLAMIAGKSLVKEIIEEFETQTDLWVTTGSGFKTLWNSDMGYVKNTNTATGIVQFDKLVTSDGKLDGNNAQGSLDFLPSYAEMKEFICLIGDVSALGAIAPLGTIKVFIKFLKKIGKFIGKYVKDLGDKCLKFINKIKRYVEWVGQVFCFLNKISSALKQLMDEYGNRNITEIWSPIADFCQLINNCPLLKDYVSTSKWSTKWSKDLTDTYYKSKGVLNDIETSIQTSKTMKGFESAMKDYYQTIKLSESGIDSTSEETQIYDAIAKFRQTLQYTQITQNGLLSPEEKNKQIADIENSIKQNIKQNNAQLRNALSENIDKFKIIDDLISMSPQSLSNAELRSGVRIGDNVATLVTNPTTLEMSIEYKNALGEKCSIPYTDEENTTPSLLDVLNNICSFTLSGIIQDIINMIQKVTDFVRTIISGSVQVVITFIKNILHSAEVMINGAIDNFFTGTFGDDMVKVINFYHDYVKCYRAYCNTKVGAYLQELGDLFLGMMKIQYYKNTTYVRDEKGNIVVDTKGVKQTQTERMMKVTPQFSKYVTQPFFDEIDAFVSSLGKVITSLTTTCPVSIETKDTLLLEYFIKVMKPHLAYFEDVNIDTTYSHSAIKTDLGRWETERKIPKMSITSQDIILSYVDVLMNEYGNDTRKQEWCRDNGVEYFNALIGMMNSGLSFEQTFNNIITQVLPTSLETSFKNASLTDLSLPQKTLAEQIIALQNENASYQSKIEVLEKIVDEIQNISWKWKDRIPQENNKLFMNKKTISDYQGRIDKNKITLNDLTTQTIDGKTTQLPFKVNLRMFEMLFDSIDAFKEVFPDTIAQVQEQLSQGNFWFGDQFTPFEDDTSFSEIQTSFWNCLTFNANKKLGALFPLLKTQQTQFMQEDIQQRKKQLSQVENTGTIYTTSKRSKTQFSYNDFNETPPSVSDVSFKMMLGGLQTS